ncbi:hypothetical protein VEIDISOL_01063 [Veillonella dispar ATCC 17748]|uniref:Uncharacterized protein n=1 Tax=Veillonella dispar ATCC 17748 TaxID=546273 RepID=C4FQJ5_9FIRM|nr:hypothetical protein [Veillonella dispar]EEP65188.1 hypothetical protein VEIDISOL_01063 [Veillonella dispar ATCC 17748]VEG93482.1 Uncharacterised protein [Veillonella dispar]
MPRTKKTDEVVDTNAVSDVNEETTTAPVATFSPEVIIASERFKQYADLIAAVIEDREYSIEEVEALLQDTLNKPVIEVFNDEIFND